MAQECPRNLVIVVLNLRHTWRQWPGTPASRWASKISVVLVGTHSHRGLFAKASAVALKHQVRVGRFWFPDVIG